MDLRAAPAVLPSLGVLAGAAAGLRLSSLPVPLGLALLAAAIALGGRGGRLIAGLSAGLLAAAIGAGLPESPWPGIDPARPVAVEGRAVTPWRRLEWGWRGELAVERLAQGRTVVAGSRRLAIELPDDQPPPARGSRLRARGYLARPPGYANRIAVPPGPWRLRVKTLRLVELRAPPGRIDRAADALRLRVEEALAAGVAGAVSSAGEERTEGGDARAPGGGGTGGDGYVAAGTSAVSRSAAPLAAGPEGDWREDAGRRSGHGTALARALVLGEPDHLPPRWRRGLRRSGLAHLLAVSGLHAGLVAGVALLAAAPLPRSLRIVVALVAVACYLAVVGPRPSILRASGMVLIAGIGVLTRRGPATGNALAVVAAVLALARPELTADVGFQLTVSATAGIVFLAPRLDAAWRGESTGTAWKGVAGRRGDRPAPGGRRVGMGGADAAKRGRLDGGGWATRLVVAAGRWLRRGVAATAGAQLASLPLALPVFHLGSWAAPALNLVAVPYTAFALAACLGWTALAMGSPEAAGAALPLLDRVAAPFGWPALGPPGAWGTAASAAPAAACWALAALAAAWLPRPLRRAWIVPAVVLAALACWRGLPWSGAPGTSPPASSEAVSLTLLDVGQGDAVLLRSGRRALLVDGGGWRHGDFGGRVLLPALLGEGVHRLDAVALTHPDADHCHGLSDVASYLPVGEVWMAPHWAGDPCADELAATPGARAVHLGAGGTRRLGGWRIEVLHPEWPVTPGGGEPAEDPNRLSLVLRAEANGRCALLTGDLDQAGEHAVLRRLADPRCELLKVGHHGSRTSTGRAFLAALEPRAALISAGRDNPYGHPAGEVVDRLERAGAALLRTDRLGLVRLEWAPGSPLSIATPAAPP